MSKVIGKGGCNLDNIRRVGFCNLLIIVISVFSSSLIWQLPPYLSLLQISGALIEISDSKTSYGDHIALLSGTHEQMSSAEKLFQAFIMST